MTRGRKPIGPEICHNAARPKDPVDLYQGMNHALRGDSSKRPGKDGHVKALFRKSHMFGSCHPISNSSSQKPGRQPFRPRNEGGVRVGCHDDSGRAGDSSRQSSIAASNLKDARSLKRHQTPQDAHLGSFGISTAAVHLLPPVILVRFRRRASTQRLAWRPRLPPTASGEAGKALAGISFFTPTLL